jgi:hypothetical protein
MLPFECVVFFAFRQSRVKVSPLGLEGFLSFPQAVKTDTRFVSYITPWPNPATCLSNSLICNHCTVKSTDVH